MTNKEKEEAMRELNGRWSEFIQKELRNLDYLLELSKDTVTLLTEMKFLDVKWLNNYHVAPIPNVNISVSQGDEKYWFVGEVKEPDNTDGSQASVDLILRGEGVLTELDESVRLSEILSNAGLREFAIRLDGHRFQPIGTK